MKKEPRNNLTHRSYFYSDNNWHLLRKCNFLTSNSPGFGLCDIVCRKYILEIGFICLSAFGWTVFDFRHDDSTSGLSKFICFILSYSSDQVSDKEERGLLLRGLLTGASAPGPAPFSEEAAEAQRCQAYCFMPCLRGQQITRKHIPRGQMLFYPFNGLHLPSLGTQ